MAELLATEKCNHYGTTFEIEFVCLWTSSVQKLAQIKIRDVYFILLMFKFSMFWFKYSFDIFNDICEKMCFIVNFEYISHFVLVFLLLTLNR